MPPRALCSLPSEGRRPWGGPVGDLVESVTRLLAVRHGETAWNKDTRIKGHLDIPLNEMGLRQAERLAEALAGETIDQIYNSDLGRARQTAEAVAHRTGAPLALDAALRERAFGGFEAAPRMRSPRWPEDSQRWRARDLDFSPGGGESLRSSTNACRPSPAWPAHRTNGAHRRPRWRARLPVPRRPRPDARGTTKLGAWQCDDQPIALLAGRPQCRRLERRPWPI